MKNAHIFLTIVLIFTLFSCKNDKNNAVIQENEEPVEKPKSTSSGNQADKNQNFKRSFSGKINHREDVVVNLTAQDGKVKGFAVVKKSGKRIPLEGEISKEGHLKASALLEKGLKHIVQADIENGEMKGGFIDPKTERVDSLSLKETFRSTIPDKGLIWVKDPGPTPEGFIKILWLQNTFDKESQDSSVAITVNSQYVYTCPKAVRAVLGYYSRMAGADYAIADVEGNSNYSNFKNLLIDALDFGYQGSEKQLKYLQQWFRKEPELLKQINNGYFVSYGTSWFRQFDSITMMHSGDSITVNYAYFDCDMSKSDRWEIAGTGKFKINGDMIKLVEQRADTVRLEVQAVSTDIK